MTTRSPNRGMPLAGVERSSAKRDALVDGDVVTHFGGLANDHSHAVIDEEAAANGGSGMDFDSRKKARDLRQSTRQEEPAMLP